MKTLVELIADIADDASIHGHDVYKHQDLVKKLPKQMRSQVTPELCARATREQSRRTALMLARLTPSRQRIQGIALDRVVRYWAAADVPLDVCLIAVELSGCREAEEVVTYWWRQGNREDGVLAVPTPQKAEMLADLLEEATVANKHRSKPLQNPPPKPQKRSVRR